MPVAGRAATEARAPSPECSRGHYRGRVSNDEQPAAPLFRVLDYEGVEVVCTIERWGAKVGQQHSELAHRQQDVMNAIERPRMVLQDRYYRNRRHHMVLTSPGRWLRVVVEYRRDPRTGGVWGMLVTVFEHRRMRSGDSLLYRSEEG